LHGALPKMGCGLDDMGERRAQAFAPATFVPRSRSMVYVKNIID
jgi:hypothetical protein